MAIVAPNKSPEHLSAVGAVSSADTVHAASRSGSAAFALSCSKAMQTNPPEPEYFFAIFGELVMLFVGILVSLSIFNSGASGTRMH